MPQLRILPKNGIYFREYRIETGDTVFSICLHFGQPGWRRVYERPENDEFRQRYPNPGSLDTEQPLVSLFVPLVGHSQTGVSRRGTTTPNRVSARVEDIRGDPIQNHDIWIIEPGSARSPDAVVKTDAFGEFLFPVAESGNYSIMAPDFELEDFGEPPTDHPPKRFEAFQGAPDPTNHFLLQVNMVARVRARKVLYIRCPMCGVTFKTVENPPGNPSQECPHDGFDLSTIWNDIAMDRLSFESPTVGQNPLDSPEMVTCRGTEEKRLRRGVILVYWDESRFVRSNGDDYELCGIKRGGSISKTIKIIGRNTWIANKPVNAPGRIYAFHYLDEKGAKERPAYSFPIPNNEITPLSKVIQWITIHHTAGPADSSVKDIQLVHQNSGISVEGSHEPAADIAYHFFIPMEVENGEEIRRVYEGRPIGILGSHVGRFNHGNIGIAVGGNFDDIPVTESIKKSLEDLLEVLSSRFETWDAWSHQERKRQAKTSGTACPGLNMISHIQVELRKRYDGSNKRSE